MSDFIENKSVRFGRIRRILGDYDCLFGSRSRGGNSFQTRKMENKNCLINTEEKFTGMSG